MNVANTRGTKSIIIPGSIRLLIWCSAERFPPVHSNSVVTSPIGEQQPPAFEDIIIMELKMRRVVRSGISLRAMEIITMTVAKFPKMIDRRNVMKHNIQRSLRSLLVLIEWDMT
jgi:hypothetical protein